jgi:mutator protein MutT
MRQLDVSIAIIQRAGRILICQRRKDDTFADLWEFPGGKIEPGETPERCLTREIQEELGLTAHITAPFAVIEYTYPNCSVRLFPYLCSVESGEPQALASQRLKWVTPAELPAYDFPGGNVTLIQEIISTLCR